MRKEETGIGLGTAEILPADDVVAGRPYAWRIVYTCGEQGVARGGTVRVTIPYGFTLPQTAYSTGDGYAVLSSRNDVKVSLHLGDPKDVGRKTGVFGVNVFLHVDEGALSEGDAVTLRYGQGHRKGGLTGEGAFVRYFEGEAEFTVAVDPDGERSAPGGFRLLDESPRIRVRGAEATQLFVTIPSTCEPGETLASKVTVRDREGNTVEDFDGRISVSIPDGQQGVREFRASDRGHRTIPDIGMGAEGIVRALGSDTSGRLTGLSNPCLCRPSSDGMRLFWGDIHVMTEISTGLDRPAGAYAYARDMSHLDFCAVTDGDDADGYFSDEEWEETRAAVRDFYDPGRFVTILASEYHERKVAGDKNIYFRDDEADLIRWSDLQGEQPEALWKALEGRKALTIPHHVVSGSGGLNVWDHHDPQYQRLVEIYSIWGNAEREGCPRPNYWHNNFGNSVQSALAKGYRLGIIASGDSHDGLAGNSSWMRLRRGFRNGLAAVYCRELTREAVFDALWDRSCYGTTGARIVLGFELNGARMGQELDRAGLGARRTLRAEAVGSAPIARVVVIRNGREVHGREGDGAESVSFEWVDDDELESVCLSGYDGRRFVYYYVRVEQEDGEQAWSSPIWVG